jgi:hypothetical protein
LQKWLPAKLFARCAGRDQPYCAPGESTDATPPAKLLVASQGENLPSVHHVEKVAMAVRHRVLEYTLYNNGGYLSQACSSAETLATLYFRVGAGRFY